jgi:hypothetical protein
MLSTKAVASFRDPKPKELFEELQARYGASSGTPQAELWATIFGKPIPENVNPGPALSDI